MNEENHEYAEPGENVTVSVKTSPAALVGLLAMDEGLLLMGTGNDISSADVCILSIFGLFNYPSNI